MTFSADQIHALSAPLDPANVASRQQAGQTLSYVEAWHVIAEANRIFGFDGWDRQTVDLRQLGEPREKDGKFRVGYSARVRITVRADDREIIREGCGFGQGIDRDPDQAHESALKEAESDAMKRALMTFGNPFGLALYDKSKANVAAPSSPAADFAIATMRTCRTADEFRDFWAKNKDALKQQLTDAEYRRVLVAKDEEVARIQQAGPQPQTIFDQQQKAA